MLIIFFFFVIECRMTLTSIYVYVRKHIYTKSIMAYTLSSSNRFKSNIIDFCEKLMGFGSTFDISMEEIHIDKIVFMDNNEFHLEDGLLVSYWYYPYIPDRMLKVTCNRVFICVCPFCGLGKDGCFNSMTLHDTMGVEEIRKNAKEVCDGTIAYQEHVNECEMRFIDMRKYMFRKQIKTFQCHACGKQMSSKQRWTNHCEKRICIKQLVNKTCTRKRKYKHI